MAIEKTHDILISDELRELLKPIETQSLVASLLLRGRHADDALVDDPVNFISIGKQDKSKISYISKDRIDALKSGDNPWTTTRRYMAKPGAFVTKVFNHIPSKEVENFSTLFQSITNKKPVNFQIVKGLDVKPYYYYESYSNSNGSLGASCMKHDHCQNYLSLYTENSDIVSMLLMLDENDGLIGRALLWDFDGNKIMDRIYTQNDEKLSFLFKQWATEHGYLYKSEQNWFNTLFFENINTPKREIRLDLKPQNFIHKRYPYMDTFKFFNSKEGVFTNYLPADTNYISVLTASDGGQHGYDHLVFDDISRVYRYRNDAAYCRYRDVWTSRQNAQYSNHNDEWILNEDAIYNEELGDYIFNEANDSLNKPSIKKLIEQRKKEREEYELRLKNKVGLRKNSYGMEPWLSCDYDDFSHEMSSQEREEREQERYEREAQERYERQVHGRGARATRLTFNPVTGETGETNLVNDQAHSRTNDEVQLEQVESNNYPLADGTPSPPEPPIRNPIVENEFGNYMYDVISGRYGRIRDIQINRRGPNPPVIRREPETDDQPF